MKKFFTLILLLAPIAVPSIAYAAFGGIRDLIIAAGGIVNKLIILMVGLALLVFFWGIVKYINHAGDPKQANEGKSIMIWGIIALFVMVSIWGIINLLMGEFGLTGKLGAPQIFQVPLSK